MEASEKNVRVCVKGGVLSLVDFFKAVLNFVLIFFLTWAQAVYITGYPKKD